MANTNVKREKPFNFMGLPGELRNMIYGYLLQGAEISISVRTFRKYIEPRPGRFSGSVHIVPRPGCFGGSVYVRKPGVTAHREKFRVAQYDSKSRLHWDLYYAEFGNTVYKDQAKGISVAIFRVNSHIHKEAEMILYKSHTFDFGVCAPAALAFFQTLPQAALRFVPRIRIDYYCAKGRHESAFCKTYNALATLAPNIKLSTKVTFHFGDTDRDLTTWPVSRALARMQGIKSLRSEKGQRFVSDFADLIQEANWVQSDRRGAIKEIEYTVG